MNNRYLLAATAIALLLSAPLPMAALADSGSSSGLQSQKSSGGAAQSGLLSKIVKVPVGAASFVVGSVVGTPVSVVRHSADEIGHAAKGMGRGMSKPWFIPYFTIVGPTAIILGGLGGALEGPWYAIENSGANCMDKPFSKEAFSLGAMEKWEAAD